MNHYRPYSTRKTYSRTLHTLLLIGMCASLLLGIIAPLLNVSQVQAATDRIAPALAAPSVVELAPQAQVAAPVAASGTAGTADKPNTEILLSVYQDGTATFDTDPANDNLGAHTPGLDSGPNNNVVRTYDLVTYRIDWNVNERDGSNVTIRATLPVTMEWRGPGNRPVPSGCLLEGSSITGNSGRDLICNMGTVREGTTGAIYPQAFVLGRRDNQKIGLTATIDTDQSDPVTSNSVETTISAAPLWDWVKERPETTFPITHTNGITGMLFIWPLTLQPGSSTAKGYEPLNDSVPIVFTDYWNGLTTNTVRITDTSQFISFPNRTLCGGYDGSKSLPHGPNSTAGTPGVNQASPTATVTCEDTGAYKTKITIAGHDTFNIPPQNADGTSNAGKVALPIQLAFFAPFQEMKERERLVSGNYRTQITNTIGSDVPPLNPVFLENVTPGYIQVQGTTAASDEITITNNILPLPYSWTTTGGGGRTQFSWVFFSGGELLLEQGTYNVPFRTGWGSTQLTNEPHTVNGRNYGAGYSWPGFNKRTNFGTGKVFEGSNKSCEEPTGTANIADTGCWYSGRAGVSRGERVFIGANLALGQGTEPTFYSGVHMCVWVDTRHFDLLNLPSTIPGWKNKTGTTHQPTNPAYIDSSFTRIPTHGNGAALVLHGGRAYPTNAIGLDESILPTPLFEVQFGKSTMAETSSVTSDTVTCNDADSSSGWKSVPDVKPDGTLDYNMVRLITREKVPWRIPNKDANLSGIYGWNYGTAFSIFLQGRVKQNLQQNPDITPIYVRSSYATDNAPHSPSTPNGSAVNLNPGDPVNLLWENQPYDSAQEGNVGSSITPGDNKGLDPQALQPGGAIGTVWYRSHHDKITIVGPGSYISKQNLYGLGQIVDVGDVITYSVKFGWNGAPIEILENAYVTETIPAWADLVSHTDPVSTTTTAHTANELRFNLGNVEGGFKDEFIVTLRVKSKAAPNSALNNTASINGDYSGTVDYGRRSSTASVYFTTAYQRVEARKTIEQANGACIKNYEFFAAKNGDVDLSNPKATGIEDENWAERCANLSLNGDITFTLSLTNGGNVNLLNTALIDLLPHSADEIEESTIYSGTGVADTSKLGDGRQPQSAFDGSVFVRKVIVQTGTSYGVYYTTAAHATVNRDPRTNNNTWTQACSGYGSGTCTTIPTNATAYKVIMYQTNVDSASTVKLILGTNNNRPDNLYTSNFGDPVMGELSLPVRSNDVSAMAVLPYCRPVAVTNTATVSGTGATGNTPLVGDSAQVVIHNCFYDFGDLPDDDGSTGSPTSPGYHTNLTGTLGAGHLITSNLQIGSIVDDEDDGQPNTDATGDGADEDGVITSTLIAGQSAAITVSVVNSTGIDAIVYGFIDFNGNGILTDTGEIVTATVASNAGASQNALLTFNVPANANTTQLLGLRVRLSTASTLSADGIAPDGEVEDYLVQVTPLVKLGNRLWIENDGNGDAADGVIGPVVGQTVTATSSSGAVYTAVTDSGGYYTITVPGNNTYMVRTGLPSGHVNTAIVALDGTNPVGNDNKNHIRTGTSVAMTTTDNLSIDFGFYLAPPDVDLEVEKTVTPTRYLSGTATTITYTIVITNHGPDDVTNANIVDNAPAHVTFDSWSCAIGAAGTSIVTNACGATNGVGNLNTTVTLRVGAEARFTINATVDNTATGPLTNIVSETLPGGTVQASSNQPDQDDVTITPLGAPLIDLELVKTVNQTNVRSGDEITFTLTITNHGPDTATGVLVNEVLPAGMTYLSSAPAGYDVNTGIWTVGNVAVNEQKTLTIRVRID